MIATCCGDRSSVRYLVLLRADSRYTGDWEEDAGAGTRIRTTDPLITNEMLYQLSYTGSGREV